MELIRVAGVNAIPGWNLSVLNFAYHVPKPWTDRFAHVSGKDPQFRNEIVPVLNFAYHLPTPWTNRDLPINLSLQQVSHGVSMCLRYSPSPTRRVSHSKSALFSPEKQRKNSACSEGWIKGSGWNCVAKTTKWITEDFLLWDLCARSLFCYEALTTPAGEAICFSDHWNWKGSSGETFSETAMAASCRGSTTPTS